MTYRGSQYLNGGWNALDLRVHHPLRGFDRLPE
jgi:hypothetical protein